jgi:GT2 family glycosyltransferase
MDVTSHRGIAQRRRAGSILLSSALLVTVVPNWNLKADLAECLDWLRRASYSPHQIIVVDNGSTDGSVELVAANYPDVILIALPENRGYAAALNAGIMRALAMGAEYVSALNNDTLVPAEAWTKLVSLLAQDATIGIAAPKILYLNHPDRLFSLGDRVYPWLPVPRAFGYKWKDRPSLAHVMEFDYVTGCAMLLRASLFLEIGLFDVGFFLFYEDSDFCRRVRDHGYRIICDGSTGIYHKASLSTGKDRVFTSRIRARNRVRFYRRYRHGPSPWLTYLVLAIVALWRVLIYTFTRRQQLIAPYLNGLLEGWREPPSMPQYTWSEDGAE